MELYVLTRAINQYDQEGDYFEAVFTEIPSKDKIKELLKCSDKEAEHIIKGGERQETEQEWYILTKIQSGTLYKHSN